MVLPGGFYTPGVDFVLSDNDIQHTVDLGSINIPDAAAFGWQTMTVPIPASAGPLISNMNAMLFYKLASRGGPIVSTNATGKFWVDNLVLVAAPQPSTNPVVSILPGAPVQGLNVWNLTTNNSYFDRNDVCTISTNGLSWAGSTTNPNPFQVIYSFTLAGFPANAPASTAWMMLVPNATAVDGGSANVDWNEATCLVMDINSTTNNAANISLWYKTNQPNTENAPNVVQVGFDGTNNTYGKDTNGNNIPAPAPASCPNILGIYSLVFTNANDGYVAGPDHVHHPFSMGTDGSAWFAENSSSNVPFLVYLGGQANTAAGMNQPFGFSDMIIRGVPNGFSEYFINESAMVNVTNGTSTDPSGVFLVPSRSLFWLSWAPPTAGFVLENAAGLSGPWQDTIHNPQIAGYGEMLQLVDQSDLLAPTNAQYFQLVLTP
jgi:hypothetical protein